MKTVKKPKKMKPMMMKKMADSKSVKKKMGSLADKVFKS